MTDQGVSVGLVILHGHDGDPVAGAIVRGIAGPLLEAGKRFITRSVSDEDSELRTYRLWARVGGVAGVVLLDVTERDRRIQLLRQIDMPFVALVPETLEVDFPAVTVDAAAASAALAAFLDTHPARRRVHVTSLHVCAPFGGEDGSDDHVTELLQTADIVGDAVRLGEQAVETGPMALIIDRDHDAVAVLGALEERGVRVPEDVALICWGDSLVCQSASRPITAIDRRGREIGALLGSAAIGGMQDGARSSSVAAPAPVVVVRETT